jgi:hypothetical protein
MNLPMMEIQKGCSTDVGYYPDDDDYVEAWRFKEPRATKKEWAGLILGFILVWALIYLMAAAFTGWWPL